MGLLKIVNPVEYSFMQWMNGYPDSTHWRDKKRFYCFVKTVCRYNVKTWKKVTALKKKILEKCPYFDPARLDNLLALYGELIEFYDAVPITSGFQLSKIPMRKGHYLELKVEKGEIIQKEVALE